MQFVLEVAILECYFLKHSQGILGVNLIIHDSTLILRFKSMSKLDLF
jgi:hypothetical protein